MNIFLDTLKVKIESGEGTPDEKFMNYKCLMSSYRNELSYIAFKYMCGERIDVLNEIEHVKKAYLFNDMAINSYNWSGAAVGEEWLQKMYISHQKPSMNYINFSIWPDMINHAFYDGTSIKAVLDKLNTQKNS